MNTVRQQVSDLLVAWGFAPIIGTAFSELLIKEGLLRADTCGASPRSKHTEGTCLMDPGHEGWHKGLGSTWSL